MFGKGLSTVYLGIVGAQAGPQAKLFAPAAAVHTGVDVVHTGVWPHIGLMRRVEDLAS